MSSQAIMDEEILTYIGLPSCNEKDDDLNDGDARVMEGEDITGKRKAFDVFVDEDNDA